mgnify:CR=1 FL=1
MAHAQSIRTMALLGVIAVAALSGGCEKGERLAGEVPEFEADLGNAAKIIKPGPNPEGNGSTATGNGTGAGGGNGSSSSSN